LGRKALPEEKKRLNARLVSSFGDEKGGRCLIFAPVSHPETRFFA